MVFNFNPVATHRQTKRDILSLTCLNKKDKQKQEFIRTERTEKRLVNKSGFQSERYTKRSARSIDKKRKPSSPGKEYRSEHGHSFQSPSSLMYPSRSKGKGIILLTNRLIH